MYTVMHFLIVIHFINCVTGIYKEMFRSNVGTFGLMIRFIDVILMIVTMVTYIIAIKIEVDYFEYEKFVKQIYEPQYIRPCFSQYSNELEVFGSTRYYLIIEVLVFILFTITLPILLCKSRCFNIGVDNS